MRYIILIVLMITPVYATDVQEQVDVAILEVWVKATDRQGNAVKDLQPNEVQLYIDDKQVDLRCFDNTFEGQGGDNTEITGRKFIFFFDLYNTLPGDMDFLKNRIRRFIVDSFTPTDRGMVFVLLPTARLGIVQEMTADKNLLLSVIRKMRGNISLATALQRSEKDLLYLLYPADTTRDDNPGAKYGVGPRPMDTLHAARSLAISLAEQEESRSRLTLNSFVSIGGYIAEHTRGGNVALIYASGGFPMRPGEHYLDLVQRTIEEGILITSSELSMYDRPRYDLLKDLRTTIGHLNRMNVTIYSLDAKGLLMMAKGAERDSNQSLRGMNLMSRDYQLQDSLVHLAQETGGLAFINSNRHSEGLEEIVRDMNEQYLLCGGLQSEGAKGKYHEIKVKVLRPGVTVRHRKGYVN